VLDDTDPAVRRLAAAGCNSFAVLPAAIASAIEKHLEDPDTSVVVASVQSLSRADSSNLSALPKLLQMARKGGDDVRRACLTTLARLAPDRAEVLVVLLESLQDAVVSPQAEDAWLQEVLPKKTTRR